MLHTWIINRSHWIVCFQKNYISFFPVMLKMTFANNDNNNRIIIFGTFFLWKTIFEKSEDELLISVNLKTALLWCNLKQISLIWKINNYSQTWVNDHLRITTTCLQRPLFRGSNFNVHNIKLPLNNDHLSTTAKNFGPREGGRYTHVWLYLINYTTIVVC